MKCLITGGAGFIGSHLAKELLDLEYEVHIIDDLSTGSIENIDHLRGRKNFYYVIDTIKNEPLMGELVDRCDVIFHLAAAVGVKLIIEKPVSTIETNIAGTEIVLRLASKKQKKVIIASSSEVYGKNIRSPYKEDFDIVLGPTIKSRWSYACSKAIDEFLALAYLKERRLPIVIIRFFNTVGPRQTGRYGMVIPNFVQQALSNSPITIFGDGKQTRSFTHVNDSVKATIKLVHMPAAVGEIFNVGNDEEISIEKLAFLVKEKAESESKIVYIPYAEAYEEGFEDMKRRVPDISKLKRFADFKAMHHIEETIKDVINYFKDKEAGKI